MKPILILFALASITTATPPASKFSNGTITRDSSGQSWTTSKFGNGTITRGPGGSTYTTSPFENGTITRGTGTPPPVAVTASKLNARK